MFGAIGFYIFFDYYRFNKGAIKVNGKILHYDEYQSKNSNGRKRTQFRPCFEFSIEENTYQVKSKTSFSAKVIPVGQDVNLLYQKGDELNARLAKGNGYGLGVLFIFFSMPAFYFGIFK